MHKYLIFITILFIASCSTSPKHNIEERKIYLKYEYFDARNDLSKSKRIAKWTSSKEIVYSPSTLNHKASFGLSYMVVCNSAKTSCKHAVIKSDITYKINRYDNGLQIDGVFNTKAGSSGRDESELGYIEHKIPESTELALSGEESISFNFQPTPGFSKLIEGPSGDMIIFSVVDSPENEIRWICNGSRGTLASVQMTSSTGTPIQLCDLY